MTRILISFLLALFLSTAFASAQGRNAWIQVESHPDLATTEQAILAYNARLPDVNGFSLGGGWYAVALGPYDPAEAEAQMRGLQAQGLIPRDSYIGFSDDYLQQFWPPGRNYLDRPPLDVGSIRDTAAEQLTLRLAQDGTQGGTQAGAQAGAQTGAQAAATTGPRIIPDEALPEETLDEARQAESRLSRDERARIQQALKDAGFYPSFVDAVFGPGTRAAISRWQDSRGHEPTGYLTARQRAELLGSDDRLLEGLVMRTVRDDASGIQIRLPLAAVAFDRYQPPFVHFNATGAVPEARVLLISQPGDRNTLIGLYDIMQTLRIVPEEGPREIRGDSFTLEGRDARIVSHTEASVENGEIKGFTLIWPAGDEARRTALLAAMRASFRRLPGVLDPAAGADDEQRVDLVSGLEIRRPRLSRSGFFVDAAGTVVTTLEAIEGCGRVTLDDDYRASVVATDPALGVAILRPVDPLAPLAAASLQEIPPRLNSDIAVAGYSYGGILGAPTLTFGRLADLRGLSGEDHLQRLAIEALEGDAGGPVVDGYGAVIGMLLPSPRTGRKLPEGVRFATDAEALRGFLERQGIRPRTTAGGTPIPPEALAERASSMTVLVSCWD